VPNIDAIELTIRMTKGEGDPPNLADLKAAEIRKIVSLSVDHDTLKSFGYTHYRVIKGGEVSSSLSIADGKLEGYPTLQVRIYAYPDGKQVTANVPGEDLLRVADCFSYGVESNGRQFHFIDRNGYSSALRVKEEVASSGSFDEVIGPRAIAL
jgi:hypothetical protein